MNKLALFAAACTLSATCVVSSQASEIVELKSLVRAVNLGTSQSPNVVPGVIMPYFTLTKDATNGLPTQLGIQFDLYDPLTNTKRFRTKMKSIAFPALPCSNPFPNSVDHNITPKFFGTWGGGRETVVLGLSLGCQDQTDNEWKENATVFVYSVAFSAPTTPWVYSRYGYLAGADALDLTDSQDNNAGTLGVQDGNNETLLLGVQSGNSDMRMILLNFKTGQLFQNSEMTMPSDRKFSLGNL